MALKEEPEFILLNPYNSNNKLISKTREHSHFGWEWMIKNRADVKSTIYAEFRDL